MKKVDICDMLKHPSILFRESVLGGFVFTWVNNHKGPGTFYFYKIECGEIFLVSELSIDCLLSFYEAIEYAEDLYNYWMKENNFALIPEDYRDYVSVKWLM